MRSNPSAIHVRLRPEAQYDETLVNGVGLKASSTVTPTKHETVPSSSDCSRRRRVSVRGSAQACPHTTPSCGRIHSRKSMSALMMGRDLGRNAPMGLLSTPRCRRRSVAARHCVSIFTID